MRIPLFLVVFAAVMLAFPVFGMGQAAKIDVDHAVFARSAGEAALLVFVKVSQNGEASGGDTIVLRASEVGGQNLDYEVKAGLREAPGGSLAGVFEVNVPPGSYVVEVFSENERILARRNITVEPLSPGRRAVLSDIVLASGISSDAAGGTAAPAALDVSADLVFGRADSLIHYYAELYNVDLAIGDETSYTARIYVSDANSDRPIENWLEKGTRDASATDRIVGSFNVAALPSGSYQLSVVAERHDGEGLARRAKRFFVFNPGVEPLAVVDQSNAIALEAAVQGEDHVDVLLRQMRVIATPGEEARMRRLANLEEKTSFIEEFWRVRENRSGARSGALVADFLRRVESVNTRFGSQRREGTETDRGAAVLKYGEPSRIESNQHNTEISPYEIWHFTAIPGVGEAMMVFVDRFGFGEFELVHSTIPGERRNPNWQAEIRRRR